MPHFLNNLQRLHTALSQHQHVFMLSHMRAYSSLFGHIMGSHPMICGYYEMHIGYYSWRSFIRQKLLFFKDEQPKQSFRYMFDKVLHNDHAVTAEILNSQRSKIIFALRPPEKTIPSILKLYQSVDPEHEFNDPRYATDYYIERANALEQMALAMERGFFFMDAEALVSDTGETLASLTQWLALEPPLSSEYELQRKTSQKRVGDSSERLGAGRITQKREDSDAIAINPALIEEAQPVYQRVRQSLIERCESGSFHTQQTP